MNEPLLSRLFTHTELQYRGEIASGESLNLFSLCKKPDNSNRFEAMKKEFVDIPHYPSTPPYNHTIRGIHLEPIAIKWVCMDAKDDIYQEEEKIRAFDSAGDFVITEDGFFKTYNPRFGGGAYSDVTYSAIIDPLKGAYEYKYILRRKIPSGDTERFHIMIGASISCHLRVKFEFFIDQAQVIESNDFDIDIWNPRDSQWHYPYKDGEELRRDIERQEKEILKYSNDRDIEQALTGLEQLRQQTLDYPFLK